MGKIRIERAEIGDLVWITDKNVHPFNFPLGRVEEVYRNDDNIVRSALIKTTLGSNKSLAIKLIPVNCDRK